MNSQEAHNLYINNWQPLFTSFDELYERIEILAKNGSYETHIYVNNLAMYNNVYDTLKNQGYIVQDYTNYGIIKIKW